jgi:transposase
MFPKAKYIVDRFHYTTYIMDALDNIRIRLQNQYGIKSKEYKLLKNKKNVSLLRKYSDEIDWWVYTKRYKNGHMIEILNYDIREKLFKINDDLKHGYYLKEAFLDIIHHSNIEQAKSELRSWIDLCRKSEIEEMIEASNTIENWIDYIVNSFINEKYTNGFTEGTNNKIKVIKRVGFGYKNFKFFRLRLLYIFNDKISGKVKKDGFEKYRKEQKTKK